MHVNRDPRYTRHTLVSYIHGLTPLVIRNVYADRCDVSKVGKTIEASVCFSGGGGMVAESSRVLSRFKTYTADPAKTLQVGTRLSERSRAWPAVGAKGRVRARRVLWKKTHAQQPFCSVTQFFFFFPAREISYPTTCRTSTAFGRTKNQTEISLPKFNNSIV